MNFQVDLGWVPGMPRFGTRYDDPDSDDEDRRRLKEEAKKGIQAYLATTGNSAEEILVQTMVCGFLFMVFLVSAHLALNSYLVARQRRKGHDDYELPGMLHFPVPELPASRRRPARRRRPRRSRACPCRGRRRGRRP